MAPFGETLQTVQEHKGRLSGLRVAFVGDGACNMGSSWALAGATAGMHVVVGAPSAYQLDVSVLHRARARGAETGGSVVMTKSEISPTSWFAVLADPDGNQIGLYEGTT